MSNAIKAQGTLLKIGSGSPVTYNAITEISSFSGPGGSAQVIDVTSLSSTAKEKMMGLHDNGQLSFEINYDPGNTQHELLRTNKAAATLTSFTLTFSDATVWTFSAYVLSFQVQGAVDGVIKASVAIEVTGNIVAS
jgi:hypothetical protein